MAAVSSNRRRQAAEKRKKNSAFIERLFDRFDTDRTGKLDRGQLTNLLTELNEGVKPPDFEVQWVLHTADKTDGHIDNQISRREIRPALDAFKSYKEHEGEIDAIFRKYDTNNSGKLEENQLARVLTDLNDGTAPTADEVKWVLQMADKADGIMNGGVNKTELMLAISLWYSHHDKADEDSSGCVVM
eukprot:TRINITY_DN81195_c0_g1_i1.p1 TRINITY_DN81195_c0_g1~~TRINITY_DN81195_c0_g1_i1.p1  ORF type:complete len:205 (-),score=21.94 TRINITY_DN81195_c0_g1_i1:342-902(-)